jgi:membrane protein DedA with SNARE-associated domain
LTIVAFLARYGYLAVFLGTFIEGETILLLGGLAAHRHYLELWGVLAAGFAGSLAGDQLYFQLGRRRGRPFLERRPRWRVGAVRVQELLRRHETGLILGFRFLYGLRVVTPLVLGTSGVPPWRFALLNSLGAAAWTTTVVLVGYGLGSSARHLLGDARRYEGMLFAAIVVTGALVWLVRWIRLRRGGRP